MSFFRFSPNEERKDRIRREHSTQLLVWPSRWAFLMNEYRKMNDAIDGKAPMSPYDWKKGLDPKPLEKVPSHIYLPHIEKAPPRPSNFPRSSGTWYGYKPLINGRSLVTERQRWTKSEAFQHDLIKNLKWPMDYYD